MLQSINWIKMYCHSIDKMSSVCYYVVTIQKQEKVK